MSKYLTGRPFMVVSYTYVLAEGQKSNVKGFGETAQWEPIENMVIVDRVTNKLMQRAELVLDLFEHKVVKCRDNSIDHQQIFDLFVTRHYEDVKAALSTWIARDPENLTKVQSFVEKFKKEASDVAEQPAD
jgi:hypothetical protein